jgi:hypothetical protein
LIKINDKATVSDSSNGSAIRPQAAGEIDLYDELVAFIELPPDEKQRYLDRFELTSKASPTDLMEAVDSVVEQADAFESASELRFEDDDQVNGSVGLQVVDESGAAAAFEEMKPQFVFKDRIVGPVCRTCGAQSEADDLFCMSCGAFLNGVDSQEGEPSCGDCSRNINFDEIFCPWCGSTLQAI